MHRRSPADSPVELRPWDLKDTGFYMETDKPPTFVLFLTDPETKGCEIGRANFDAFYLRLIDGRGSELIYKAYRSRLGVEARRELKDYLLRFPRSAAEGHRKKIAAVFAAWAGLTEPDLRSRTLNPVL